MLNKILVLRSTAEFSSILVPPPTPRHSSPRAVGDSSFNLSYSSAIKFVTALIFQLIQNRTLSHLLLNLRISIPMEVKSRTVRSLVNRLSSISTQTQLEALSQLRLLTKHDPDSRPLIADSTALPVLTELLYSPTPSAQENAVATLLNLSISNRDALMSTRGLLDALSHLLRQPTTTPAAIQTASATLHSLLLQDSYRPIIGAKRDILFALIEIIRNPNSPPRSIKDGLKALFGVSLYPLNRVNLVDLGVIPALFTLVVKDGRVGIVEDATAVIAQVAGCYESGEGFRKVSGIGVLVDLLDKATGASVRSRENAVGALLNLIQCGDEEIVGDVRELGMGVLIHGIREVAENGSSKARNKANELLNILERH